MGVPSPPNTKSPAHSSPIVVHPSGVGIGVSNASALPHRRPHAATFTGARHSRKSACVGCGVTPATNVENRVALSRIAGGLADGALGAGAIITVTSRHDDRAQLRRDTIDWHGHV